MVSYENCIRTTAAETVDQRCHDSVHTRTRRAPGRRALPCEPRVGPSRPNDAVGAFTPSVSIVTASVIRSDSQPPMGLPGRINAPPVTSSRLVTRSTTSAPPLARFCSLPPGSRLLLHATVNAPLPDPASSPLRPSMAASSTATSVHDFIVKVSPIPLVALSTPKRLRA